MVAQTLITVLTEIRSIITEAGETDFRDLGRKRKAEIFDTVRATADFAEGDGDGDGSSASFHIEDATIWFSSYSTSTFVPEMRDMLTSCRVEYEEAGIDCGINFVADIDDVIAQLTAMLDVKPILNNLTPHDVVIFDDSGTAEIARIPATGTQARVAQDSYPHAALAGVPVVQTIYGQVSDLPAPQPNVYNIVSIVVAQALAAAGNPRTDVLVPDSGPASVVRDGGGQIRGVRRLMRI